MKLRINWDALGIATSVACAIHCAFLPLFLTSLPLLGIDILSSEIFEIVMIVLAFLIGAWSLSHGYRKHHHHWLPLILFSIGFCFLIAKQVVHHKTHAHAHHSIAADAGSSAHPPHEGHSHEAHDHAHNHNHAPDYKHNHVHEAPEKQHVSSAMPVQVHSHKMEGFSAEMLFLCLAVAGIVSAHIVNYYKCRKAGHCHTTDCNH